MPTNPLTAEVRPLATAVSRESWDEYGSPPPERIKRLARGALALCDALDSAEQRARAAEAERDLLRDGIERLAKRWQHDQAAYPNSDVGMHAAAAVRCCIEEMRALAATPPTEEPER